MHQHAIVFSDLPHDNAIIDHIELSITVDSAEAVVTSYSKDSTQSGVFIAQPGAKVHAEGVYVAADGRKSSVPATLDATIPTPPPPAEVPSMSGLTLVDVPDTN